MYKIEIKGSSDDLKRVSIFLDNNFIKHNVINDIDFVEELEEPLDSFDWPLELTI